MTHDEALSFLWQHQPMPSDSEMTDEKIKAYETVRQYFLQHPDPACVPLFLNSFGEGSGFGVYQVVDEVIKYYHPEDVIPHLMRALSEGTPSVKYWCAQIAGDFPVADLVDPLGRLLMSGDYDLKSAAITALMMIKDPRVDQLFNAALEVEEDPDLREHLIDTLEFRWESGFSPAARTEWSEVDDGQSN